MNRVIKEVTKKVISRSKKSREIYLNRIEQYSLNINSKTRLSCSNLAHAIAPMDRYEKELISTTDRPNIAIITAYNDMLSAHQPYSSYPNLIKEKLKDLKATSQVAGGVPAMCDGVTQSQTGMELSLFSRDNIAMGTAIGLSHNMYDGVIYLGVCDKIVPGLFIGAMAFGHLPSIFIPSGPMPSGISNAQKAKVREEFAKGKIGKDELLKVESASYHSCGTCTFYGTANSNQMLLEMMGLQLPNSSFVNSNTPLREELTKEAVEKILTLTKSAGEYKPISKIIDERSFINAIVGLMATGGSTNHAIHLIAMARAAGVVLTWDDFDAVSKVTPLICKMYPNGEADVNHFRDAGGMSVVISQLLKKELLHQDVETIVGEGLLQYIVEPSLNRDTLIFKNGPNLSRDVNVISSIENPFCDEGGLKLLCGNIGRSIIKTSALKKDQHKIEAPAVVFNSQEELKSAFESGKLDRDFVAIVRYQGPKANGMPELHGLMPILGVLQNRGFKVALITDGRMSGASGKIPSAIHLTPEAIDNETLSKIEDGDLIDFDIDSGKITLLVDQDELNAREIKKANLTKNRYGVGRELFSPIREAVNSAEEGASIFDLVGEERC